MSVSLLIVDAPPERRRSSVCSYGSRTPSADGFDDVAISSSASRFLLVVELGEGQK